MDGASVEPDVLPARAPGDLSGWKRYYTRDATMSVGAELRLGEQSGSVGLDADADFRADGHRQQAQVVGSGGAAALKLIGGMDLGTGADGRSSSMGLTGRRARMGRCTRRLCPRLMESSSRSFLVPAHSRLDLNPST